MAVGGAPIAPHQVAHQVVEGRHLAPGAIVLDLGCGGGTVCFIASQVVGPTGRVIRVDLHGESGLGVIVVEIDPHEMRDPELHEPIPGIGTVMLDRLAWYPQSWLHEHIGNLPDDRHRELGRLIRNLIGP